MIAFEHVVVYLGIEVGVGGSEKRSFKLVLEKKLLKDQLVQMF